MTKSFNNSVIKPELICVSFHPDGTIERIYASGSTDVETPSLKPKSSADLLQERLVAYKQAKKEGKIHGKHRP